MFIPEAADWEKLAAKVKRYGMYNQNLQAVPPTGSISYINHSTSSIHPVTSNWVETRKEGKMGTLYVPTAEAEGNEEYFGPGYSMFTIDPKHVIDVYSIAQYYVDQGLSLTLGYLSSNTTRDVVRNFMYAFSKGKDSGKELDERGKLLAKFNSGQIKTLYYARVLNESLDELDNSSECV
jgi:ribonucleoside-diphosphate reductase alpha chain